MTIFKFDVNNFRWKFKNINLAIALVSNHITYLFNSSENKHNKISEAKERWRESVIAEGPKGYSDTGNLWINRNKGRENGLYSEVSYANFPTKSSI